MIPCYHRPMSEYKGSFWVYCTLAEEKLDYPKARDCLKGYADADLFREYHESLRGCFDRMFGHNSKKSLSLVVDELRSRGITELPNIFSPIPVKKWGET